jgi:hypothetical protein
MTAGPHTNSPGLGGDDDLPPVLVDPAFNSRLSELNLPADQVRAVIKAVSSIRPDAGEPLGVPGVTGPGLYGFRVITAGPDAPAVIYRPLTEAESARGWGYLVTDVWTPATYATYKRGNELRQASVAAQQQFEARGKT